MDFERNFIICTPSILKIKMPSHPLCDLDDVTLGSPAVFTKKRKCQDPWLSVLNLTISLALRATKAPERGEIALSGGKWAQFEVSSHA